MNNKYLKYFLIAGVVSVWGLIVYKVVYGLKQTDLPQIRDKVVTRNEAKISADTFVLYADYPDPFIPEKDLTDTVSLSKPVADPKVANAPNAVPSLPNKEFVAGIIQFNGIVSNPQKRSKVAIISVHGKEMIVHEKQRIDDIFIKKIDKEKLQILYKGRSFTIEKMH